MLKKVVSLLSVLLLALTLGACVETPGEDPVDRDTIPPAFIGAIDGKLSELTHLKGEEIDLLQGVVARDNLPDQEVTVVISNFGGYDLNVAGTYTITITATDEDTNSASVTRKVVVLETIVREMQAVVIGDDFTEYVYNREDALMYTTSGTAFRATEIVQVMTKEVFVAQYNQYSAGHTNNGGVPFFPNGVIAILDTEFNVQLVRVGQTASIEINAAGELKTEELTWSNGIDAVNGGGNFKNILDAIEEAIPTGGYLMFTGNFGLQSGKNFLMRNFFFSGYQGGVVTPEQFDATYATVEPTLVPDFQQVIALPDAIETPVLDINRHVLSWQAVPNTKHYEVYVDGELATTTLATSLALSTLNLAITLETEDGYDITVKAISLDIYRWSSSLMSEIMTYRMIELQELSAPVLNVEGETLTWATVEGAESYDVFITVAGVQPTALKIGSTLTNSFDLSSLTATYNANVKLQVQAIGDNEHYDSLRSANFTHYVGEQRLIAFGTSQLPVVETTVNDYFLRRNTAIATDPTGYANYPAIFLVTDIFAMKSTSVTVTEAFGVVVLLDSTGTPKVVRSVFGGHSWSATTGWISNDPIYTANSAQLAGFADLVEEGDQLLIFRNTAGFIYTVGGTDYTVNIRNLGAHFFVKAWGETEVGRDTWRDAVTTFMDPSSVTFNLVSK